MPKKPAIISLYTGAGGLDYGFEAAGFRTAVALEMDRDCVRTLRLNRRWPVIDRDIHDVPSSELLETGKLKKGEAALLIGGPPCQPFSKSGYWSRGDSRRLEDPRASTMSAYLRVLRETLPQGFVLENVEGLAYKGKDEGLRLLLEAVDAINREAGTRYRPHVLRLNAADYGVPQLRHRVLVIAGREGQSFRAPEPTHADLAEGGLLLSELSPYRTAWDALADVRPDASEDLRVRGRWAELLPSIPEGHNYLWHTDRLDGLPLFGWRRRYWSFLLKLAKDRPSWTIQAQPGPAIGPFHWESRLLSMRELCRLQTFPDDVVVTGSRGAQQKQIGNAVPSLLGEVVGREIRVQILGMKPLGTGLTLMPPDRSPAPPPERVRAVPARFRTLAGPHEAHPGTGRGTRASARALPA